MLEIIRIPVLNDNYVWLIHTRDGLTAVVDPAVSEPVMAEINAQRWTLTHILNTHHHADHTGGNLALKELTNCTIVGPSADQARIPGIDVEVGDGETYQLGSVTAEVLDIPGHTHGHIAYHFAQDDALFCGDTLFALGCGRVFEGTMEQMWSSLSKIATLPSSTKVYCAHEYTQANGRFALSIEPNNRKLISRMEQIDRMRAEGIPTVPSILGDEFDTNPFLRPYSDEIQETLDLKGARLVEVFTKTRLLKDSFKG